MLGIIRIQHRRVRPGRTGPARLHGRTANTAPEAQRDQLPLVEIPVEGGGFQEAVKRSEGITQRQWDAVILWGVWGKRVRHSQLWIVFDRGGKTRRHPHPKQTYRGVQRI